LGTILGRCIGGAEAISETQDSLVRRAAGGDAAAFAALVMQVSSRVRAWLHRRGASAGDVEDLAQEVFLAIFKAFRAGRYEHREWPSFLAWVKRIAQRVPLPSTRLMESDHSDHPDPRQGPEPQAAGGELGGILMAALDEVSAAGATGPSGRQMATLRKAAFLLYYAECCTQPIILQNLSAVAAAFHPPVRITSTMLNNWLSRGDIVRALVRHLVEKRPSVLERLCRDSFIDSCVAPPDRQLALLLLRDGVPEAEAARVLELEPEKVRQDAERIRAAVGDHLSDVIKADLHTARSVGQAKGKRSGGPSQQVPG
jgi:DNA-directed RNA polymerase specialized sigma24 family protein